MSDQETFPFRPPAPVPPDHRLRLPRLLTTLARNPLECWSAEFFRTPISTVRLPFRKAFLVHEPSAIKRVLLDNAQNYRKDPLQRRILANGLADGLLSVEDKRWETQRRTLAPLFAKRSVNSFSAAMLRAAENLAARWRARGGGAVVNVAAEMTLITLKVLAQTIFSDGIGGDFEQFSLAMNEYFGVIGRIGALDLLGAPVWVPRPGQAGLRRTMSYFEGVIDEIIQARRQRLESRPEDGSDDILTLLLRALDPSTGRTMSLLEVRSNILTFLSAGHETTSNALAWSIFLLSQSAPWRDRVSKEAVRELRGPVEGLTERLVITRAVVEESLRLYPPIAALSRIAERADTLSGVDVNPGSLIVVAPYVLHRHLDLWQSPDIFDPARFLGPARNEIDRFAYLPFGTGPRTCIGASFALQEATLVLAVLMSRLELTLLPDVHVWPIQRVTLRPSELPMRLALR